MIESVVVILFTCLCLFGVFQYAHLFACKSVLAHAATRAARARTVGFNHWMVVKSAQVAAIPASGRRITPVYAGVDPALASAIRQNKTSEIWDLALRSSTRSPGAQLELARIPDFMASGNAPTSQEILNYELWDQLSISIDESLNVDGETPGTVTVEVRQQQPLLISRLALAQGELKDAGTDSQPEQLHLAGFYSIENHYPLYLEDMNW